MIIGQTLVGSHMWGMNTAKSDLDIFQVYVVPSNELLLGIADTKPKSLHFENADITSFEVGHVIKQLLKGNLNFIIGVASPRITHNTREFMLLRAITIGSISKNCYHSIHGMACSNYKKYEKEGKLTERKCNQILRIIEFGNNILKGGGLDFSPFSGGTAELIEQKIVELADAYQNSKLREKPDKDPFERWLLNVRKKNLDW